MFCCILLVFVFISIATLIILTNIKRSRTAYYNRQVFLKPNGVWEKLRQELITSQINKDKEKNTTENKA